MMLYNPTPWEIKDRYEGRLQIFASEGTVDVDPYCATLMLEHNKMYGLVALTSADGKTFDKKEKKIEGLRNYLEYVEESIANCMVMKREIQERSGGEVEERKTPLPFFKARKEEVLKLLGEKPSIETKKEEETKPVMRKRGRPRIERGVTDVTGDTANPS